MNANLEDTLRSELRQVADGLHVPALPPLPQEDSRAPRQWQPLLVAAAVVLVVTGLVGIATMTGGRDTPDPAPSPPAPTPSRTVDTLTTGSPTVPYVYDGRLHVDGERVPGTWLTVDHAGDTWVALREDNSWWWSTDTEPLAIEGTVVLLPQLSPDGSLLAYATTATADVGEVRLVETRSGEVLGTLPLAEDPQGGYSMGVVAVTDDGKVFLEGDAGRLMWLAPEGGTVDLATTVPDQSVLASTSAGLVVLDGNRDGEADAIYLAEVSDSGELTRLRTLPGEDIVVNPSGTWLAHGGSRGGESETISSIRAQSTDGRQQVTLEPPDDRDLIVLTWEDDDLLLADLVQDGRDPALARCSVREQRCVVIETE